VSFPSVSSSSGVGSTGSYGDRTLDELKALAASVETGRIHDMQAALRRCRASGERCDRPVDDAAKDLPGWWGGTAADSCWRRSIRWFRTRELRRDGSWASQALMTCAQVVGEQQLAMGTVPEVAVPMTQTAAGAAARDRLRGLFRGSRRSWWRRGEDGMAS